MKILVIADIHGDFQALEKVLRDAEKQNPDILVSPGNLTDMFKIPQEFSQMDIADIVVQKLLSLGNPLLCVPGNHDPYEILELFNDYKINTHNKSVALEGFNFIGFGGAQTPFQTLFEPSEEETKESLSKLSCHHPLILVTHNPPKNTKMDKIKSGQHVGSQAIKNFILEKKPLLTITAHIHEAQGEEKLGSTTIFNPGPVFKGNYGTIEIQGKKVKCTIHKTKF